MTALYTLSKLLKYFWLQLQMQPLIIIIFMHYVHACMYVFMHCIFTVTESPIAATTFIS